MSELANRLLAISGSLQIFHTVNDEWFEPPTQYCAGDKIEKNEMGWACGAYEWGEGGV